MRASFFALVLASVASVSAAVAEPRGLSDFPKCAVPCLLHAPRGHCSMTDFHCLCHNQQFIQSATSCAMKSCHGDDIRKAKEAQAKTCRGQ